MRVSRTSFLIAIFLCAPAFADFHFDAHEEKFTSPVDQSQQTYLVQSWNHGNDKNVGPLLVIYLHGAGGNQSQGVTVGTYDNLFGKMGEWLSKQNAVYICPEYRGNSWMGPDAEKDVVEILRLAKEKYRPIRVLLTGASMGGTSALIFASRHPGLIDGVIAWCPATEPALMFPKFGDHFRTSYGGSPEQMADVYRERTSRDHAKELAKLPSVIIHGKADAVIPVEHSRVLVERLKDLKANVNYIEVEGGHDAPLREDPAKALEWLLDQIRTKAK
jgi:pimeloyl-ACP methyl ester carboxylesterase